MIRNNKWKLVISSIIILLPAVFGLVFWDELPWQVIQGSNRFLAVFALPLILLGVHWLCLFFTMKDPKNKAGQNEKALALLIWINPVLSLFVNGMVYALSLGKEFQPFLLVNLLLGLLFIVIGNYMPKYRQNYTMGIKVKWALENEENWNATHRVAGKVWVIGGLLLIACLFLPSSAAIIATVILVLGLSLIPIVYSYWYHRKQLREGRAAVTPVPENKTDKAVGNFALVFTLITLVLVGAFVFSGDVEVIYGEDSFTVEATGWKDLSVAYDAVAEIEYRDDDGDPGMRTFGYGGARLLAGAFRNEEFGDYTRYSYTRCHACVVLDVGGEIVVLSGPDEESTNEIYRQIRSKLG